uniref:Uncharacterized protein AlNc14C207G8848 n=1 Tax=Albugo laibachii Nc14 TaxID=890382 RepID=F0WR40_9STRA|nr:conserved hypothetical protein [Albugo laibachii Nc14]|eukprot:CCA23800.1 conserved hypothetical protein [Albugo laibachii Nc14]
MIFSRISSLLHENPSLLAVEMMTYITFYLIMKHIFSSGKQNRYVFLSVSIQMALVELLMYDSRRWHAAATIPLLSNLPLYYVLLVAQMQYISFVATSRLRIQISAQPFAMACFVVLLVYPFELMGVKFLWWTLHDTDPYVQDRVYNVPISIITNLYAFSLANQWAFIAMRELGLLEFRHQENCRREVLGVMWSVLSSLFMGFLFKVVFYGNLVLVIGIHPQVWITIVLGLSLLFVCLAVAHKDDPGVQAELEPIGTHDAQIFLPASKHAINRAIYIFSLVLIVSIFTFSPSNIVSVGYHQMLGDCSETEEYLSWLDLDFTRPKYVCVYDYDEDYTMCGTPLQELSYRKEWFAICGRDYEDFGTYVVMILAIVTTWNVIFHHVMSSRNQTKLRRRSSSQK